MLSNRFKKFCTENKAALLITLLSLAGCLLLNETNVSLIKKNNPSNEHAGYALMEGDLLWNYDSDDYLTPAENFLAGKGWQKSPSIGNGAYFRRTPGYALIYFCCLSITSSKSDALSLLKTINIITFLVAVFLFYKSLILLEIPPKIAVLFGCFFGLVPWFSIYTYYALTESLSPFLMIFFVYWLLKASQEKDQQKKTFYYIIASCFISYAILTRPITGIAALVVPIFIFKDFISKGFFTFIKKGIVIGILPIAMLLSWGVRNYLQANEFVLLEKAVHPENLDRQKPEFIAFWNFLNLWGTDGAEMNTYHLPFYRQSINGDTSMTYINNILANIPQKAKKVVGENALKKTLVRYRTILNSWAPYIKAQKALPNVYTNEQLAVKAEFEAYRQQYITAYPFEVYVRTPLKFTKDLLVHSNTSAIYLFQSDFRHISVLNYIRLGLVLTHILFYLLLFIASILLLKEGIKVYSIFVAIPMLTILFFTLYFQAIEQRYMLPFLPLVIIASALMFHRFSLLIKIKPLFKSR